MNRFTNLFLSFLSGALLWSSWPASPFTFLIFFAWIPLLWIESRVKSGRRYFALVYLVMFLWNISTTWWIVNASVPGALAAFFANSFLMCLPWLGYRKVKKRLGETKGLIALIAFWMLFEYIHLQDWGLSWPWLTLGNVFASRPSWIQWYEFTGTSAGTCWILIVNILLFKLVHRSKNVIDRKILNHFLPVALVILIPLIVSLFMYSGGTDKLKVDRKPAIVVVQPNIDPYEKISEGSFDKQLQILLSLSSSAIDTTTELLVWPETALYTPSGIDEERMKEDSALNPLWNFLRAQPQLTLFSGIESFRIYDSKKTKTARPINGSNGLFYDSYNGSALMDSSGPLQFYHKSMLVPGVETLPWFLRFIDKWFEKFGGTTAGYARQDERTVLQDTSMPAEALAKEGHEAQGTRYKIAPSICYESIYGEFMSKYISNGANVIVIITNDGWWRNTPGYKQHMNYARLRAIENRKWVARSANTGISCFIDPYGNVIDPQPWNKAAAIKNYVPPEEGKTFFVKYGDILSKLAGLVSILLVIIYVIARLKRKD